VRSDLAVVLGLEEEKILVFPHMTDKVEDSVANGFNTLLIFVDGLADRIGSFLERLYETYGNRMSFLGGGAGSVTKDVKPIITQDGLVSSGACGFLTKAKAKFKLGHGWKRFFGPLIATKTDGNKILSKTLVWMCNRRTFLRSLSSFHLE